MIIKTLQQLVVSQSLYYFITRLESCQLGLDEFCTIYISVVGDIDFKDTSGSTLLFRAVQYGNVELVKKLIELKANPCIRGILGYTPLNLASLLGNVEIVRNILCSSRVDVNERIQSYTSLHLAVICGHTEVVKELSKHTDIDTNIKCNVEKKQFNVDMEYFLSQSFEKLQQQYKKMFKIQNCENNVTALQLAIYYYNPDIITLLLHRYKIDLIMYGDESVSKYLKLYYDNKEKWFLWHLKRDSKIDNKYNINAQVLLIVIFSIAFLTFIITHSFILKVAATAVIIVSIIYYAIVNNAKQLEYDEKQIKQNIQDEYHQKSMDLEILFQRVNEELEQQSSRRINQEKERAEHKAQESEQRAEQEAQRAAKLEEALRNMGVDPSSVLQNLNTENLEIRRNR